MFGILIGFCTTLSWSIGIFPFTEAARRLGVNSLNHFRLLLALFFLSLGLVFFYGFSPSQIVFSPTDHQWLWLGISGLVGLALGDHFGFSVNVLLGARRASLFSTLAPGFALVLGIIMLNEGVNWVGVVGILISCGGVLWMMLGRGKDEHIKSLSKSEKTWGIVYGVLGAACQGGGLVLSKKGMVSDHEISAVHATWIRMVAGVASLYFVTIVTGRFMKVHQPLLQNKNKGLGLAVLGTFFGPTLGVSLSLYTVSLINVSVAQTILSMVPVFAIPLSYLFYREKITLKSLIGAMIAITGVLVLIWRNELLSLL